MLERDKFEWSFGNGYEGRRHRHSGYCMMTSGRVLIMGLCATAGNAGISREATVNLVVNGSEQEAQLLLRDRASALSVEIW